MTLGEKLQTLRSLAGLSQEELAEQLGVSRQAVSKWELDKTVPEVRYIVSISGIFGVTTDFLLKEDAGAAEPAGSPGEQTAPQDRWEEPPDLLGFHEVLEDTLTGGGVGSALVGLLLAAAILAAGYLLGYALGGRLTRGESG